MIVDPTLYISVARLKQELDLDSLADDTLLARKIREAQTMIDQATRRVWKATADTTRRFDAAWDVEGRTLWFPHLDLCAITTVVNGDGATITSDKYVTEPRGETPCYGLTLRASSGLRWTYTGDPEDAIAITGRWAFSVTPPDDIVDATVRLAGWLYRQRDASSDFDRVTVGVNGTTMLPASIPQDIRWMLERRTKT